jgi:LuxR family maltose regulon positive regulatory protein
VTGTSGAESAGFSATPLVRAKLRPPAPAAHYVRRPRLLDLLDGAAEAPLTLVVAPAGAGKTSLVAGWAIEATTPTGWLSLDERDRDAAQVWRGIVAALETVAPGCGDRALTALRGPDTVARAVAVLLDDLVDQTPARSVLVLDDLHVVDEDAVVAESLAMFVAHLPAWLRLIAVSRRDLPLPLDRLRARGQLCEIRFAELRFSRQEAGELLSQLAPLLVDDEVDVVVEQADGWAASLQLAALGARSAAAIDPRVAPATAAGDAHLVQDYVAHEVLVAEDPALVDAMHDLAVADKINPSLARALTGRADASDLLRQAEERGLFVTRLPTPGWYEIHGLVRSSLVAELEERSPERLAELHARAARWYEEYDEPVVALEHWLLAGRPRDALHLLAARHADLYDGGREATVRRVIAAIPADVAGADLTAMLEFAWCHLLVDRDRFLDLVDRLDWWAGRPDTEAAIRSRVTILRGIAAIVSGRWVEGGALARQAMADMGGAWWRDPLGRFGWNMVGRDLALSERWADAVDEVREAELALSRDAERRLSFEGTRALGEALAGRPIDALRVAAGVRRTAVVTNMTIMRIEVEVAEALARRESGDRARALDQLEALAATPGGTMLFCQVLAMCELVQAYLDGGDVARARDELTRAEDVVEREAFGGQGRDWVARAATLVALAEGDPDRARRSAEQVEDAFWGPIGRARVDLAAGRSDDASAALAAAVPRGGRHRVVLSLLRARAADVPADADRHVAAAVEEAVDLGLLQTVASEGADLLPIVERSAWRAPESWMDRLRRAAAPATPAAGQADDPVAELTSRERDVLRLLAGRLTVREIASELYISPNTLKFHLKTIYRKLGVGSRAEAAAVARRMATVPSRPDPRSDRRPVRPG